MGFGLFETGSPFVAQGALKRQLLGQSELYIVRAYFPKTWNTIIKILRTLTRRAKNNTSMHLKVLMTVSS